MLKRHLPANCQPNRHMLGIDGLLYHFISAVNVLPDDPFNLDRIIQILEDYRFSANYLIDREGQLIELVPLPFEAWHAGSSRWRGRDHCNRWMVGIEIMGGTDFPYLDDQIATLTRLSAQLMTEHGIPLDMIAGHDQVREEWNRAYPNAMDTVKVDPGPHFPWDDVRETLKNVG